MGKQPATPTPQPAVPCPACPNPAELPRLCPHTRHRTCSFAPHAGTARTARRRHRPRHHHLPGGARHERQGDRHADEQEERLPGAGGWVGRAAAVCVGLETAAGPDGGSWRGCVCMWVGGWVGGWSAAASQQTSQPHSAASHSPAGNADLRNHLEARFGPGSATADERSKLAVDVSRGSGRRLGSLPSRAMARPALSLRLLCSAQPLPLPGLGLPCPARALGARPGVPLGQPSISVLHQYRHPYRCPYRRCTSVACASTWAPTSCTWVGGWMPSSSRRVSVKVLVRASAHMPLGDRAGRGVQHVEGTVGVA